MGTAGTTIVSAAEKPRICLKEKNEGVAEMTDERRHTSLALAVVMVFIFALLAPIIALAQESSGAGAKAEEATLFPVPDFTSGLWQRSRLTGDWGGLRTKMANNGIQLDADTVHLFQNVTSGGVDRTGRYVGTAEIVLKLDSNKMGLWPGGFLLVRGEAAFGTGVSTATGAVLPVNTEPVLQLPARDEMVLTHVVLTQFLAENFGVAVGKLYTTEGDAN